MDVDVADLETVLRRVLGSSVSATRTEEGVSALVYRVVTDDGRVVYARVAEEAGEDLSVDAALLDHLATLGVPVPTVVHVAPFSDRSILVTTEVAGAHLGRCADEGVARIVAREAGRHLAVLNTVEVDGWGWVVRSPPPWPLRGTWPTYPSFVHSEGAAGDLDDLFTREAARDPGPARLAHGDFDCTPIFHVGETMTGFIDFGEIRGAEPTFDLGHFLLHDGETSPFLLFDHVAAGYCEVAGDNLDLEAVRTSGLLLGARQLARWYRRGLPVDASLAELRRRQLDRLLLWSGP